MFAESNGTSSSRMSIAHSFYPHGDGIEAGGSDVSSEPGLRLLVVGDGDGDDDGDLACGAPLFDQSDGLGGLGQRVGLVDDGVSWPASMSSVISSRTSVVSLPLKAFRAWQTKRLSTGALIMLPRAPDKRLPSPCDWMSVPWGVSTLRMAPGL